MEEEMFGYGPTDLRRVTPVRKSSDNLSVFAEEERHQETSQSSSESFRFNPEGSAFRRPNRTGYPVGSSSSGSISGTNHHTNAGRPVYGAFEHHVPFPTPLSKGEQQRRHSELDDSPFGHDTPFSPDPSIIGNYEHITESPNNFFHEGSFRRGQQGPPSPDIMGLVTQLVHSQMPPDRFVNEFGKDSGKESMGIGAVSTSLDFESTHNHSSYEYLYNNDNNRQQSTSSLSSQQLQMGFNRYNGVSGTFQTEGSTTHYQPGFEQQSGGTSYTGGVSFESDPGGLISSAGTTGGSSYDALAMIYPKFSGEPQMLNSSHGSASQQQQQQYLGLAISSQNQDHRGGGGVTGTMGNQSVTPGSVVRSSSGSLSVSTSTGSWVSPQPSPLGQHQQPLQQHIGGPWVHDNNNGGGGSMEGGGGGIGGNQFSSQSRPPPALYPAPPPLLPSRPYPNGNNTLGTGYHSEPTLTEILAEARRKQAAHHGTTTTIDTDILTGSLGNLSMSPPRTSQQHTAATSSSNSTGQTAVGSITRSTSDGSSGFRDRHEAFMTDGMSGLSQLLNQHPGQGHGQQQQSSSSSSRNNNRDHDNSNSTSITENVLTVSASAAPFIPGEYRVSASSLVGMATTGQVLGRQQQQQQQQGSSSSDSLPLRSSLQGSLQSATISDYQHPSLSHHHSSNQLMRQSYPPPSSQYNPTRGGPQSQQPYHSSTNNNPNSNLHPYIGINNNSGNSRHSLEFDTKQTSIPPNANTAYYDPNNLHTQQQQRGLSSSGRGIGSVGIRASSLSSTSRSLSLQNVEETMRSSLESKHSHGGDRHSERHAPTYLHVIDRSNINPVNSNNINTSNKQDRQELVESPQSKLAYKDFYRHFRTLERDSVEMAKKYAEESLQWMPERAQWRVLLEMADLAKRSNEFEKARELYAQVCDSQPLASQGWLEWSKMEEECGHVKYSLKILRKGLSRCQFNEGLLTKAIKQQEKLHNMEEARGMLSILKHESIERVWKAVLEGALLEARAGRIIVARKFLQYLIQHVPWYGPIYHEAFKLEERDERDDAALAVVKKGLRELPRYGPLWFGLLRVVERRDAKNEMRKWLLGGFPQLIHMREEAALAVHCISRELVWKVHFERAQAEERAADAAAWGMYCATPKGTSHRGLSTTRDVLFRHARLSLVKSLLSCPANLQWKIWLAGARLELSAGSLARARGLLCRAFATVPAKSRSHVYLECSRVEEYANNLDAARRILSRARNEVRGEWKVFLESVLLEARAGNFRGAVRAADEALILHAGTGRLWAILVQICHRLEGLTRPSDNRKLSKHHADNVPDALYPVPKKESVLRRALREVPKSGEVWCEGARCHLNPLHVGSFDLSAAQKYLGFAVQFTPQYGDTFIEYLRLEVLIQVLVPRVLIVLGYPVVPFFRRYLQEDVESDLVELLSEYGWLHTICHTTDMERSVPAVFPVPATIDQRQTRRADICAMEQLEFDFPSCVEGFKSTITKSLSRRCTNSDPNYGTAWFHCRTKPYDTPATVIKTALHFLACEMASAQPLYVRAVLSYIRKCLQKSRAAAIAKVEAGGEINDESGHTKVECGDEDMAALLRWQEWSEQRDEELLEDFEHVEKSIDFGKPMWFARGYAGPDFVTASVEMNRLIFSKSLNSEEKRKVLFGSDSIIP